MHCHAVLCNLIRVVAVFLSEIIVKNTFRKEREGRVARCSIFHTISSNLGQF
jgi:hypothetical protein